MSDLLLVSEAARELECSAPTVRNLEARGILRAIKTPSGTRVFRREDVERLAAARRAKAAGAKR